MSFSWSTIKKPIFALAPMANITTLPFRSICREMGADVVFTPMLSSNAIVYNPNETFKIAEFLETEQPVIVQIFGYDGDIIAQAAQMIDAKLHPAGIDINMGCPAPKITGNECGSGLLRDYEKALKIAETVRKAYKGPLSVKVRLGWREFDVLPFVQELERIGIDAVTVHGRTTKEGYSGSADWTKIEEIAEAVNIPVIGNGDITNQKSAWMRLEKSHLAGVMIGRGALGNPWIFRAIKEKQEYSPSTSEINEIIIRQAKLAVSSLGEEVAIRELRKHLGWYLKDFPGAKTIRTEAMKVGTLADVLEILDKIK